MHHKTAEKLNKELAKTVDKLESEPMESAQRKVGTFVVFDAGIVKGVRINLEKVRSYAIAQGSEDAVHIHYDNGTSTVLKCASDTEAKAVLAKLDQFCL